MAYRWSELRGVIMKKGLTLIEVILAIALISIISISFLPGITFGFKNLIESKKFTEDVFSSQMEIEKIMEAKRKETGGDTFDIFGVTVAGHNIDYGELHVFQPEIKEDYPVPKIIRNINSGLPSIVRLSAFNKSDVVVLMLFNLNLIFFTENF